jgi:GNAT superfamily N-acetyltransferase
LGPLSNLFHKRDAGKTGLTDSTSPLQCRPARAEEVQAALRMILGSGGRAADNQQIIDFLTFARHRGIDLNELWVGERSGAILWAAVPILSPGRTMLLFTPADPPTPGALEAVGMIADAICQRFMTRNVQLAQALLDPGDEVSRRIFESRQFARMAELIYLHAAIKRPLPPPPLGPQWTLHHYSPQTHHLFASAILASYRNSLDCPGLNGVRSMEDIIAGHKSSGDFNPEHWYVLCSRDEASGQEIAHGVLLLTRLPRGDAAELVYLGLAPQARGRGLGEWMMRQAFTTAASMGVGRLSLAVDSTNSPALKLYYRFGMARMGSKVAMMRKLL